MRAANTIMEWIAALLLACGLAVDSALVALAQGLCAKQPRPRRAVEIGLCFGLFQAGLLVAGSFAAAPVAQRIGAFDHWIAFAVLFVIGVRTIREAYVDDGEPRTEMNTPRMLAAGVATSLDALAAGFGLSLAGTPIVAPAVAAFAVTVAASSLAYLLARRVARGFEKPAHWAAGVVLIAIGARILWEHLE